MSRVAEMLLMSIGVGKVMFSRLTPAQDSAAVDVLRCFNPEEITAFESVVQFHCRTRPDFVVPISPQALDFLLTVTPTATKFSLMSDRVIFRINLASGDFENRFNSDQDDAVAIMKGLVMSHLIHNDHATYPTSHLVWLGNHADDLSLFKDTLRERGSLSPELCHELLASHPALANGAL